MSGVIDVLALIVTMLCYYSVIYCMCCEHVNQPSSFWTYKMLCKNIYPYLLTNCKKKIQIIILAHPVQYFVVDLSFTTHWFMQICGVFLQ